MRCFRGSNSDDYSTAPSRRENTEFADIGMTRTAKTNDSNNFVEPLRNNLEFADNRKQNQLSKPTADANFDTYNFKSTASENRQSPLRWVLNKNKLDDFNYNSHHYLQGSAPNFTTVQIFKNHLSKSLLNYRVLGSTSLEQRKHGY